MISDHCRLLKMARYTLILLSIIWFGFVVDGTVSVECVLPTIEEGYAKCWNYSIIEVDDPVRTRFETVYVTTTKYATDIINGEIVIRSVQAMKSLKKEIPLKVKQCRLELLPYWESRLQTEIFSLYMIDVNVANGGQKYPNNIICTWSIPYRGNLLYHVFLQEIDIEDAPDCSHDNLTIDLPNLSAQQDAVVCGSSSSQIPGTLKNRIYDGKMYIKFQSNSDVNGKGFRLLIQPLAGRNKRSVHVEDLQTPCLCPEVPSIEKMCPLEYLETNPVYHVWKRVQDHLKDKGYSHPWGFSGFKGCLGAEFFRYGEFVDPTPEECQHMTFGMGVADIQKFTQPDFVNNVFLKHLSTLSEGEGHCSSSMVSSRASDHDLVALNSMLNNKEDVAGAKRYLKYSNPFVRHIAELISQGKTIPAFSPVKTNGIL